VLIKYSKVNISVVRYFCFSLTHVLGTGLGLEDIARWNFPLPELGTRLERVAEEIHNGRGFMVLSGLDPSRYTTEKSTIIYLGIASYIGDKRGLQNSKGRMLCKCIHGEN
jgi:hypothetical protein